MIAVSESEPNYPCHSPYIKHQLINKHMKDPEMFKMSETYEKSRPPAQRNCSDMTSETLKRSSGLKSAEAGRGKRKQFAAALRASRRVLFPSGSASHAGFL